MQEQINFYYSAATNAFYPVVLKADYDAAGTWPDDAQALSDRWYQYLIAGQSEGKNIIPNEYSQPILSEPPAPSPEELNARALTQKTRLMAQATAAIATLQDAVELEIATEDETAALSAWKKYRVLLSRINPEDAPDIVWPEAVEDVA